MGLIGVVLAWVVGMVWPSDGLQFVLSCIGVFVFTGLAAYDAQRMKAMALASPGGPTGAYAIVGALARSLDFITLFLMLVRVTGSRREYPWRPGRPALPDADPIETAPADQQLRKRVHIVVMRP